MEKVVERFLRYVKFDTRSMEDVEDFPSTKKQLVFLNNLKDELDSLGLHDVTMDKYGYVFACLPSNINKNVPKVGFISHGDTSPEVSGENVKPQIIESYSGGEIVINKELGISLSPGSNPELKNYIGKTLIATDGNTLLGADDKAGVAEIVTAAEYLINHPEIKHGEIKIGFTPDEEVGRGVDFFDVERFGADFAYTVDGGALGELEYENFNAASAKITVYGKNTHPGTAKNIMKNSMLIASELMSLFPQNETPGTTEGYEGFYHIISLNGDVEKTTLKYIIRDFDLESLKNRKTFVNNIAESLNRKYGDGTIEIELKDQYYNMVEKINEHKEIVDIAKKAMERCNIKPVVSPIRGGTDGARLSFMGLPTPNLFTGGHNFHGRQEYIPTFAMEKSVEVILKIISLVAE